MNFRDFDSKLIDLMVESIYIIDMTIVYSHGTWLHKAKAIINMKVLND